jgi:pimeloyl-ACP methyl ester carboxylesterase
MVNLVDMLVSDLGDVTLQSLTFGPEDGPLALCLHGFPDTAYTFRHLGPHLAKRGYRVVAPFMRGYAPSSLSSAGNYQVAALASDANRLHELLNGDENALLVGHDWGAVAAYPAAAAEPSRWHRLVTLAIPPLTTFAQALATFDQLRASWYMFYFQNPLAEAVVRQNYLEFIAKLWAEWSPGYDAAFDLGLVREALSGDDNLRAALGYYRAMFDGAELIDPTTAPLRDAMFQIPESPTLYLHGESDGCFKAQSLGTPLEFLAPGSRVMMVPGAGHFLHLEQPSAVHDAIDSFLDA